MNINRGVTVALFVLALIVAGCAGAPAAPVESPSEGQRDLAEMPVPATAPELSDKDVASEAAGIPLDAAYQASIGDERMIIRTANLSVVVKDTAEAITQLEELAKSHGGYVANSSQYYKEEQLYASMTVRVPAESLEVFLDEIHGLATRVESQNVSGDDVTEEYVDIEARLRNLEATEQELLALLTEVRENRGKADEILAVHRELTSIREQIDALEGRKNYLERMTALSTVQVEIRPEAAPRTVVDEPWKPAVTLSNAARTLVSGGRALLSAIIYLVVLSPLVLVPLGLVLLVRWLIRRGKKTQEQPPEA